VFLPDNGDSLYFTADSAEPGEQVPHGSQLIDQTGVAVSGIVVKDRLMLSEQGILAVVLTINKQSGRLLNSPDIISRGFVSMRGNEPLMNDFRAELSRAVQQRYKRVDLERFRSEMREFIMHFMFEHTAKSPIVIPVLNIVGGKQATNSKPVPDQTRFQEMRAKLLTQKT